MKRILFLITMTIVVSSLFAQTTPASKDLETFFAGDKDGFLPITELTVWKSENLTIYPSIKNVGSEALSGEVKYTIKIKNTEVPTSASNPGKFTMENLEKDKSALMTINFGTKKPDGLSILTSNLNTYVGTDMSFTVTITMEFEGDENTANNSYSITVHRMSIEAYLAKDYDSENLIPISTTSTYNVADNTDLLLHPYIYNNDTAAVGVQGKEIKSVIKINDSVVFTKIITPNLAKEEKQLIVDSEDEMSITIQKIESLIGDKKDFIITYQLEYKDASGTLRTHERTYKAKIATPRSDITLVLTESFLSDTQIPLELSIKETEDLILYPTIKNLGPDMASQPVKVFITLKNSDIFYLELEYKLNNLKKGEKMSASKTVGSATPEPFVFTSKWLEEKLKHEKDFTVHIKTIYTGIDQNGNNNEIILKVKREEVLQIGQVDLAPYFVENILGTPFYYPISGETITLSTENSLNLFPALKNHGDQGAFGAAKVTMLIDYKENGVAKTDKINEINIDLNNFTNDKQFLLLSKKEGLFYAPEFFEKYGKETFNICIECEYTGGTDGIATNNKFCHSYINPKIISVEDIREESNISIYPNPAKDIINIEFAEGEDIKILNTLGEVIIEDKNVNTIDISNLCNGTYFIKVGSKIQKFVIIK